MQLFKAPKKIDAPAAGRSAPLLQRSQYLADALRDLQKSSENIRTPGELVARLAADAILQGRRSSTDKKLSEAQAADLKAEADSTMAAFGLGADASTPQPNPLAEAITGPQTPPVQPQAQPIPGAMSSPIQVNPLAPVPGDKSAPIQTARPDQDALLSALQRQERGGTLQAENVSPKGARGPMQVMPGTQSDPGFGVAPARDNSPEERYRVGVDYLKAMQNRYGSNELALAAYNAGPGRVDQWLQQRDPRQDGSIQEWVNNIPIPETRQYVQNIMRDLGSQQPPAAPQLQQAAYSPPAPPMAPPPQAAPPSAGAPGGTAPAAPVPSTSVAGATPRRPTQQQIQLYQQWMSSGDPAKIQAARAYAQSLQKEAASPDEWETEITRGGQQVRTNKRTGEVRVTDVPGFRQQLSGNLQYDASGKASPIPGAEDRTVTAEELGIPAAPGTVFSVSPTGKVSPLIAPPEGFSRGPQGLSVERGGRADPTSQANIVTEEAKLRTEYAQSISEYQEARQSFSKVLAAANDASAAGDLAMIFNFMKTLDPGSVVREGEQANAQNAAGVPDRFRNLYNNILTGQRLNPEQRSQFVRTAGTQFKTYEDRAKAINERFTSLATDYGFNPSRIISPLRPVEGYNPNAVNQSAPAPRNGMGSAPPSADLAAAAKAELARRRARK